MNPQWFRLRRHVSAVLPVLLAIPLMAANCDTASAPQCTTCGLTPQSAVQVTINGEQSSVNTGASGCVTTDCGATIFDPLTGRQFVAQNPAEY